MKNSLKKITLISLATFSLSATALGADYPNIYVGIEGGYSKPLKKKFKHVESGSIGNLTGSKVYEGKIGYRFDESMAIELSYAYRPDYELKLDIPDEDLYTNMHSKGKVKYHAIMANIVYFAQPINRTTPYFLAGIGYSRVSPQKTPIYGDIPLMGMKEQEVGNVMKHKTERLGFRIGAGVDVAMSDHLALTFGGKLEVVNNIRLNTRFINIMTKQEVRRESIKKTIGIGELTAGLKYSF